MWVRVEGKTGVMKAKRYWPRKAEWPYNDDEGGDFRLSIREKKASTRYSGDDPRLRRLAQSRIDADYNGGEIWGEEILESRRVERMAADEEDDDDDEALAERRRKIKEKVLQQEVAAALLPEESESELESESEYESDPVEEMAMVKPVFVPKSDRDTIAERDKVKAEEQAREVEAKLKILKRKRETREIVVEKIKDDFEIQKNMDDIIGGDVDDDDDDVNEEESYEAWKGREIARVRRDEEKEKEEEERRDSSSSTQSKKKRRFMQRHYHKGCFFQNDADDHAGTAGTHPIYARDFSDPTGEDKMDKTILPKVMQVKHFGRRGRTKWTHLLNEDTTHRNNVDAPTCILLGFKSPKHVLS